MSEDITQQMLNQLGATTNGLFFGIHPEAEKNQEGKIRNFAVY